MARIKRGVASKKRHKRILKQAKGYYGNRSRSFRVANQAVMRAGQNAYAHRKMRKRDFRKLWISRINAGARNHGLTYSNLIHGLKWPRWISTGKCWPTWLSTMKRPLPTFAASPKKISKP